MRISHDDVFDFGANLRRYRNKKKLTQKQLGQLVGCSEANIGSLEANTSKPTMVLIIKLCGVFNITADDLLGLSKHDTIIVDGLTDEQKNILELIISTWQK